MTAFQKVIKYLAIAFAIYLIIMIVGVIFSVFAVIIGLEKWSNSSNQEIIEHNIVEYSDVKNMDIKLGICKLEIKEGEQLKVETSDVTDKFKCEVKNGTLKIEDNKMNTNIFENKVPQVTIYIPKDYKFEEIDLELGINNSNIYELNGKDINIEIGVGKARIDNLNGEKVEINGGAGETVIDNFNIERLDLEAGIGSMIINGKISDNSDIVSGIGRLEINLVGQKDDYELRLQRGIGNLEIDGEKIREDEKIGSGSIKIRVEAGIGETEINFVENNGFEELPSGTAA